MADRVLQVLGTSAGGIRRHVAALAGDLGERGWDVLVAGPSGVMTGLHPQDAVVEVGRDPRTFIRGRRQLRSVARTADLVHAHGLTAGWLALLTPDCRPLVVTVHNLVVDDIVGRRAVLDRRLESLLCRRADAVIATSASMAAGLAGRAPHTPVVSIPPVSGSVTASATREEVRAAFGVPDRSALVVAVARLHTQKDHATLLEAVRRVRDDVPSIRALFVGDGPLADELRRRTHEMGLAGVVTFAGSRDDAPDLIAAADVLVVSSRWESGPLVVREALELGTPVVSTSVGFVPEVLAGSPLDPVPVGDAARLAAELVAVLGSADVAEAVVNAGREGISRVLDPVRLVADVEHVYHRVLSARA